MSNATDVMSEQMNKFVDMQARMFEPMRVFGTVAVDTMDEVVRKHYAVMGDVVEYTLRQARLPMSGTDAGEIASQSMAETTAFGELLGTRANEYAEIVNGFNTRAKAASEQAAALVKSA